MKIGTIVQCINSGYNQFGLTGIVEQYWNTTGFSRVRYSNGQVRMVGLWNLDIIGHKKIKVRSIKSCRPWKT